MNTQPEKTNAGTQDNLQPSDSKKKTLLEMTGYKDKICTIYVVGTQSNENT